jgi:hypothetical protein
MGSTPSGRSGSSIKRLTSVGSDHKLEVSSREELPAVLRGAGGG